MMKMTNTTVPRQSEHIQDAAETLPTFFLRIVKDLFGHACLLRY